MGTQVEKAREGTESIADLGCVGVRRVCVRLLSEWWKNMMESAGGGGVVRGGRNKKRGGDMGCERVRGVGRILFWE